MDRARLPEALKGGYVEQYSFDWRRQVLFLQVEVLDQTLLHYEVRFQGISSFSFETESRGVQPDDRLELTEMWIEEFPEASRTEDWIVLISLWDLSHLRIRCAAILVDGVPLR